MPSRFRGAERPDKRSSFEIWSSSRFGNGERLLAFEEWVAVELSKRLQWPSDPARMKRQVGQCRAFVLQAVADMGKRGFLFDPKPLAAMIVEVLDDLGKRQARGEIKDLFPYFKITWQSYVGSKAEELKQRALSMGSHISQASSKIDSMTSLVERDIVERIRDQKAAARKRQRRCDQATAIGDLFDLPSDQS